MKLKEKGRENKITMKKLKKQVKGITLIALVVTIIVLLILAGVAINLTIGDNGLFKRAQNAAETWDEASKKEAIEMAVASIFMDNTNETSNTKQKLEETLKAQYGEDANVEDNKDGSFLITIGESKYYIGEDGKIIDSTNMLEISSAEELKAFRDDVNTGNSYEGKYVYLTDDITITLDSNEQWEPIGFYPMENSSPADETNKPFKGIFDGRGHEINGIYINITDKAQGLFGLVNYGIIKNIVIGANNNVVGGAATAGVVGYLYNKSKVLNCCNKGNVSAPEKDMIGGIVGQVSNECIIKNCYNSGTINGSKHVGGIAGNVGIESIIENCYNTGNVTGAIVENSCTGGICGDCQLNSKIMNCYNVRNDRRK